MRRLFSGILLGTGLLGLVLIWWLPIPPLTPSGDVQPRMERYLVENLRQGLLSAAEIERQRKIGNKDPYARIDRQVRTFGVADYIVLDRADDIRATNRGDLTGDVNKRDWNLYAVWLEGERVGSIGIRWHPELRAALGRTVLWANGALLLLMISVAGLAALFFTERLIERMIVLRQAFERLINGAANATIPYRGPVALNDLASVLERQVRDSQGRLRNLADAQERFEQAARLGKVAIWDWDVDSDALVIGSGLRAILQPLQEEDHGQIPIPTLLKAWIGMIHEADRDPFWQALRAHMDHDQPFAIDLRMARADGSDCWLAARGQILRRADRSPYRMLGVIYDIDSRHRQERMIQQERDLREQVIGAIGLGIVLLDRKGRIVYFNVRAARMTGWDIESAVGIHVREVCRLANKQGGITVNLPIDEVLQQRRTIYADSPALLNSRDGSRYLISYFLLPLPDADGRVNTVVMAFREEEETTTARSGLSRDQTQVINTLRAINDAVVLVDNGMRITYLNPAAERLCGWGQEQVRGMPFTDHFRLADPEGIHWLEGIAAGDLAAMHGGSRPPVTLVNRWEKTVYVDYGADPIRRDDSSTSGAVVVIRDVSDYVTTSGNLVQQAKSDPVTGLANRSWLAEQVAQHLGNLAAADAWYLWIEVFPAPALGYRPVGRAALWQQVGATLTACPSVTDHSARLDGGSFACLLAGASEEAALAALSEIRTAVTGLSFVWEEQTIPLQIETGLLPLRADRFVDLADLLQEVDRLCPRPPVAGTAEVSAPPVDSPSSPSEPPPAVKLEQRAPLSMTLKEERFLAGIMENALNTGQLLLFGRGVIGLNPERGLPTFVQILLRLKDKQSSQIILPGEVIAAAERFGLMFAVDRWVLQSAIENIALAVENDQQRLKMAPFVVKLSSDMLGDSDLPETIKKALIAFGLAPSNLCLAFKERGLVNAWERGYPLLQQIQEMGCLLCVDHYGMGMIDADRLRKLQVHCVMFDLTMIQNLPANEVAMASVEAAHRLAKTAEVVTVAPGVEDATILKAVQDIGVDYVQGDYFDQPKPLYEVCFAEE